MKETMFQHYTNIQLRKLIKTISHNRIGDNTNNPLFNETRLDPKNSSCSSGMWFLNRGDLLELLYTILYPEIILIDNTPAENLALYINYPWSIPELKTRYNNRMRGDI
jgi:hypothetical protein